MSLIDDICDGCGGHFDPMGDPMLTRHLELGPYAVFCEPCERAAASARITDTAGRWQTLTVRFRPPCDMAATTGYGESVTVPVGKALMEAFGLESVEIADVWLIKDDQQ